MPTHLEQIKTAILQNHINVSTLSILIYEFFAIIANERKAIWGRRFNAVSILFLLNRYVTILYAVLGFAMMFTLTPTVSNICTVVTRLNEAVTVFLFIIFAIFPAVRIYAIWQRNLALGWLVFCLLVVPAVCNVYLYAIATPTVLTSPKPVCILREYDVGTITRVVVGSRTVSEFAEALVLVLTCIKTLGVSRESRSLHMQASISQLLVRKGVLYFLIFLILNVAQTTVQETTGIEYLSPYLFAVTSILMSRFLLNLRQLDERDRSEDLSTAATDLVAVSEVVFHRQSMSRFVANFGADLEFAELEASEE